MAEYFEDRIQMALSNPDKPVIQRRLSTMADRDLALALEGLDSRDKAIILDLLLPAKAKRVEQEREYLRRLRFTSSQRRLMAERLADALDGRRGLSGGTWIAPGRSRNRW